MGSQHCPYVVHCQHHSRLAGQSIRAPRCVLPCASPRWRETGSKHEQLNKARIGRNGTWRGGERAHLLVQLAGCSQGCTPLLRLTCHTCTAVRRATGRRRRPYRKAEAGCSSQSCCVRRRRRARGCRRSWPACPRRPSMRPQSARRSAAAMRPAACCARSRPCTRALPRRPLCTGRPRPRYGAACPAAAARWRRGPPPARNAARAWPCVRQRPRSMPTRCGAGLPHVHARVLLATGACVPAAQAPGRADPCRQPAACSLQSADSAAGFPLCCPRPALPLSVRRARGPALRSTRVGLRAPRARCCGPSAPLSWGRVGSGPYPATPAAPLRWGVVWLGTYPATPASAAAARRRSCASSAHCRASWRPGQPRSATSTRASRAWPTWRAPVRRAAGVRFALVLRSGSCLPCASPEQHPTLPPHQRRACSGAWGWRRRHRCSLRPAVQTGLHACAGVCVGCMPLLAQFTLSRAQARPPISFG